MARLETLEEQICDIQADVLEIKNALLGSLDGKVGALSEIKSMKEAIASLSGRLSAASRIGREAWYRRWQIVGVIVGGAFTIIAKYFCQ